MKRVRFNTPVQQTYLWLGITVAAFIAAGMVFTTIIRPRITTHVNAIQDALLILELNAQQQKNYSEQSKQIATIQSQTQELDKSFFSGAKALDFVKYIESLAAQTNVTQDLNLAEPARIVAAATTFTVDEKTFSLHVTGTTVNTLSFLKALETNPAYMLTSSVTFNRTDQGMSLDLKGTIPWQ